MKTAVTIERTDTVRTVGGALMFMREKRGMSREAVADRTKIPVWFISAVEEGNHDGISEDVYTRLWLKAYCGFLGLDAAKAYSAFRRERSGYAVPHDMTAGIRRHPHRSVPRSDVIDTPKIIRYVFLAAAVAAALLYFGLAIKKVVAPPSITLLSPPDGLVTDMRSVSVEGRTEQEVSIFINGKRVAVDDNGNFRDILDLQEGVNTIKIVGSKKHSREMEVLRRIIVEPGEQAATFFNGEIGGL